MRNVSSPGLVGRGLAAIGALLWILSMFLTFYSSGTASATFWEIYTYADVVTLVLAVAVLLIVMVSLVAAGNAPLAAVAVISGYLLALAVTGVIEADGIDIGAGGYVAVLGAAAVMAGVVIAIVPMLVESTARVGQDLAFMTAEPTAHTSGASAGWYADPSGEARLRYWDGSRWGESTKS